MEQINFLNAIQEVYEKEKRAKQHLRYFLKKREQYKIWKQLPRKIFVHEKSFERKILADILYEGFADVYSQALHECPNIPEDRHIWLNHCHKDYWIMNTKGNIEGEYVAECPYCGAKLAEGKGDAVLYKAKANRWETYLTNEVPKYEHQVLSAKKQETA